MAATKEKNPQVVTVYGRLSYPTWEAKAAYERSLKGKFPTKDIASSSPDFNVLLEPSQLDKFLTHVKDEFFPFCQAQAAAGAGKHELNPDEVKALLKQLDDKAFDGPNNMPLKPVPAKTAELAPEVVASLKCIGNKGTDIVQQAIVYSEQELVIPDPDILKYPIIKPIGETVHSMYGGCLVAVTVNLYAYHNGKHPGFSAGASVAVFKADADSFGGGVKVDESEIFDD